LEFVNKINAKEGSITGSKNGPNCGDNIRGRNCVCEFAITHTIGGMANICQTKDDGDYYQMNVSSLFGLSVFGSRYISSGIICVIVIESQFWQMWGPLLGSFLVPNFGTHFWNPFLICMFYDYILKIRFLGSFLVPIFGTHFGVHFWYPFLIRYILEFYNSYLISYLL